MGKPYKLNEGLEDKIREIASEMGIENHIHILPVGTGKSKQLIKVSKTSAITEYVQKKTDSVTISVYDQALERLDENQQELIIRDAMNQIHYDFDKDKITIGCPSITVSVDGRMKYGEELLNACECAVHVMMEIEEEEKQRKAEKKKNKKKSFNH